MQRMSREDRIQEIMDELGIDHDPAELMFLDEICQKYNTDDFDVAEAMFETDNEDEYETGTM